MSNLRLKILEAYTTNSKATYFEKHYRENMDISDYESMVGDGGIYYGSAGTGKTLKLCEMTLKAEDPIILSFTKKAIVNVKKRLIKIAPTS